MTFQHTI